MDSKKNKEDWLTVRVGADLKNTIKLLVDDGKYPDMSTFVIQALKEKLSPEKRGEIVRQELIDLKRADPQFFRELFSRE